ncbi:serine/threonine protein kinase [Truncatella angustata]|uniref:Serine/threonine protein kinase n=1 Tax=Truncatella angustata TaxID=152316 RepID=A0A9P8ZVY6_9PEZI|nr:serine/threonine protein kinase [Truncatella angustata]KAH6652486.1 serine/threonine protein kinase [Truncatella angustata]
MGDLASFPDQQNPIKKFKLSVPLDKFPSHIFDHAATLEHLDLSGTGISSLPDDFGKFKELKIAFFSNCNFAIFPRQLASCPKLEMVAFRSNSMREIPEDALPLRLRWLILTNNVIEQLPKTIGNCSRLQKCMLSGNQIRTIPTEMSSCQKLGLLRLSANRIEDLPHWLFEMPELAFLSFAGNPCSSAAAHKVGAASALPSVCWTDIEVQELLGEGASGVISQGQWKTAGGFQQVAVKLFKGDVTSDGTPLDEMSACIHAGSHDNLIDPLGEIQSHPNKKGLVMQLIPPSYITLGLPPSLESCTRDCFPVTTKLSASQGLRLLQGIASAAAHLHARGIAHGDLYAHNILYDAEGHALLGDFGAASIYENHHGIEKLEVLAFAHLIEDVQNLIFSKALDSQSPLVNSAAEALAGLRKACGASNVDERPSFAYIGKSLADFLRSNDDCRTTSYDGYDLA